MLPKSPTHASTTRISAGAQGFVPGRPFFHRENTLTLISHSVIKSVSSSHHNRPIHHPCGRFDAFPVALLSWLSRPPTETKMKASWYGEGDRQTGHREPGADAHPPGRWQRWPPGLIRQLCVSPECLSRVVSLVWPGVQAWSTKRRGVHWTPGLWSWYLALTWRVAVNYCSTWTRRRLLPTSRMGFSPC
jgi:hypothetical protein